MAAALLLAMAAAGASASTAARTQVTAAAYEPPPHLEQWWYDAMGLADLQERTDGGKGVQIAVFDGYVDTTVPDLQGADITVRPGCNEERTPRDVGAEADHGTAMVTALVGQGSGNGPGRRGVLGVVPNATISFYSMNESHDDGKPDCDGYFTAQMIERAVADGADVIAIQVTGGLVGGMDEAIDAATDQGVVVVSSAGNANTISGIVEAPADVPGVVAVVAGDKDFRPWVDNPRSNAATGNLVTFTSPGVATPLGGFIDGRWVSGAERTGTSGASAIAAGAFAIVKAAYPDATGNQLVQAAVRTSRDDGTVKWTDGYGYGGIRSALMMERDPAGWPDENPLRLTPQQARSQLQPDDYQDPAARAEETSSDAETREATTDAGAEQEPAAATADDDESTGGPPVAALAAGGGLGLVVLLGAVVLARRRRARVS